MFECGLGERSSNLVAKGFDKSLINPISIVLFLEGLSGLKPNEVTIHTGASKPGYNLLNEVLFEDIIGFITS